MAKRSFDGRSFVSLPPEGPIPQKSLRIFPGTPTGRCRGLPRRKEFNQPPSRGRGTACGGRSFVSLSFLLHASSFPNSFSRLRRQLPRGGSLSGRGTACVGRNPRCLPPEGGGAACRDGRSSISLPLEGPNPGEVLRTFPGTPTGRWRGLPRRKEFSPPCLFSRRVFFFSTFHPPADKFSRRLTDAPDSRTIRVYGAGDRVLRVFSGAPGGVFRLRKKILKIF